MRGRPRRTPVVTLQEVLQTPNVRSSYQGQQMFEAVKAPVLLDWSKAAVRLHLKRRAQYENKLAGMQGGELVKQSFFLGLDPSLSELLFKYKIKVNPNEITPEEKDRKLEELCQEYLSEAPGEDIIAQYNKEVSKSLRMRLKLGAEARVMKLFQEHERIVEELGLEKYVEENPKEVIKKLVSVLEPSSLRIRIAGTLSNAKGRNMKADLSLFFDELVSQSKIIDSVLKIEAIGNKVFEERRHHKPEENSKPERNKPATNYEEKSFQPKRKKLECYNCKGNHPVRLCPTATQEQKAGHEAALKSKKGWVRRVKKQKVKKTVSRVTTISNKLERGFEALLGMKIPARCCADSGADESLVSREKVQLVMDEGINVQFKRLEYPYLMGLADGAGNITVIGKCLMDIKLKTDSGYLVFRNVVLGVTKESLPEVLLGQPLLVRLGLDAESLFSLLASRHEEVNLKEEQKDFITPIRALRVNRTILKGSLVPPKVGDIPLDHPDFGDDMPDPVNNNYGANTTTELQEALCKLVGEAEERGLPKEYYKDMKETIENYKDIFRVTLGKDPPVNVPPMKVLVKAGAVPYKTATRRYSVLAQDFMKEETRRQIELGLAYLNPRSQWASAPFCVMKKVEQGRPLPSLVDLLRMTIDLKEVNSRTTSTAWPMPNLEVVLRGMTGAKYFAIFDLTSGYWQFGLDASCQEYFSYMTDKGVYTPTRVPQGAAGSVAYVQSSMCTILGEELIYVNGVPWIDDILLWAVTVEKLLEVIKLFFVRCRLFGLKLHAWKSKVFSTSVVWCGRLLSGDGVSQDPTRLEALRALPSPKTGADLQQFVCAINWIRMSLPNYAPTISPLMQFMEKTYKKAGGRTRNKVKKISLEELGWGLKEDHDWENVKKMLENSMTLAHLEASKIVCVFTDASEDHWGAICTQIPKEDQNKPLEDQRHQLLAFLSHSFQGSQKRWAIVEKEAYAIVATCIRLEYMLVRQGGFRLFTDHRNLAYIFSATATSTSMGKHTAAKLQRWALLLMAFEYEVQFLDGDKNVWADLLTRWGASQLSQEVGHERTVRRVCLIPVSPTLSTDFVWPSSKEIQNIQQKTSQEVSKNYKKNSQGLLKTDKGKIWIPSSARNLQTRLCVVAHSGSAGHRGIEATTEALSAVFWWKTLSQDVSVFIKECLHCLATTGPHKIPVPLGEAIHATKPNEVLHMDYLYMKGVGDRKGDQYISVLKDDLSGFIQLTTVHQPTAQSSVDALQQWAANFGLPKIWVSDGGSHYHNQIMEELSRRTHTKHHIVIAYTPWANGTVESMMSQILRVTRALLSEWRLHSNEWISLVPIIQAALNHAPSSRLGGRAPVEIFTGLQATRPLDTLIHPKSGEICKFQNLPQKIKKELENLQERRDELHKQAKQISTNKRNLARNQVNKKRNSKLPNYNIGDFVLVGAAAPQSGKKLSVWWQGPYRITKVLSEWVYEVTDLVHKKKKDIHVARLKFYSEKDLEVTEDLKLQAAHNEFSFEVDTFLNIRFDELEAEYKLLVKWRGFDESENSWEPLKNLVEDVPVIVKKYLSAKKVSHKTASEAISWLKSQSLWR